MDLMKSDLGKRVSERLVNQGYADSDEEEGIIMDAVTLCCPYIEELFSLFSFAVIRIYEKNVR